ncbi:hypothetical protein R3P38DRAFT_2811973 [Favolaschia claudopus]|uniref:Uncharacterized protein n=1 Tax=Favolaschia claudopus TaxID=2862362 RepID=A0AAV9Z7T4_9AGAR
MCLLSHGLRDDSDVDLRRVASSWPQGGLLYSGALRENAVKEYSQPRAGINRKSSIRSHPLSHPAFKDTTWQLQSSSIHTIPKKKIKTPGQQSKLHKFLYSAHGKNTSKTRNFGAAPAENCHRAAGPGSGAPQISVKNGNLTMRDSSRRGFGLPGNMDSWSQHCLRKMEADKFAAGAGPLLYETVSYSAQTRLRRNEKFGTGIDYKSRKINSQSAPCWDAKILWQNYPIKRLLLFGVAGAMPALLLEARQL